MLNTIEKMVDYSFGLLPRRKPADATIATARLIAHRGAHDTKLAIMENTQAAFTRAFALGCWGIELDVHATADGVLVVNHDPCLTRLWGKPIAIRDLNFQVLRELVPELPSLQEVISRYGKQMHLFIELKAPFTAEAALQDSLHALQAGEDYHLLSLDEPLLASLTAFPREAMLLVPVHNNLTKFCKLSLQKQYGGVLGHYLLFTTTKIRQLQQAKQIVGVGFIDSKFSLYRELNRGVSWLFSNKVELLSRCLSDLQAP